MNDLGTLYSALASDPWREASGFSPEIECAHAAIDQAGRDRWKIENNLNSWLQRYQPCLFGRLAARQNHIAYCTLLEEDILRGDDHVRTVIQNARTNWLREGFKGRKSGFVLQVISQHLRTAEPNAKLLRLAQRIAALYLLTHVECDTILLDEIFLELEDGRREAWKWYCGVNFFGSGGDQRWWHDHRFPGGIAFSVNSVGHMVKAGMLTNEGLLQEEVGSKVRPVDTLEKALLLAMKTISGAASAPSGPATYLLPSSKHPPSLKCPIELPRDISGMNHCDYVGLYHTDYTLPCSYFTPATEQPTPVTYALDFTYLFDDSLKNPDHLTTGRGLQIRHDSASPVPGGYWPDESVVVDISDHPAFRSFF